MPGVATGLAVTGAGGEHEQLTVVPAGDVREVIELALEPATPHRTVAA